MTFLGESIPVHAWTRIRNLWWEWNVVEECITTLFSSTTSTTITSTKENDSYTQHQQQDIGIVEILQFILKRQIEVDMAAEIACLEHSIGGDRMDISQRREAKHPSSDRMGAPRNRDANPLPIPGNDIVSYDQYQNVSEWAFAMKPYFLDVHQSNKRWSKNKNTI